MSLTRRRFVTGLCTAACVPSLLETAQAASNESSTTNPSGVPELLEARSLFTAPCFGSEAGVEVSFSMGSGRAMLADARCHLIIHHDYDLKSEGWIHIPVTRMSLPIFVSYRQYIQDLDLNSLTKIIYGQVTHWEEVGGRPGRIQLAMRRSTDPMYSGNEADWFHYLLLRGGIEPARFRDRKDIEFFDKYEQLADTVRKDYNVLAFGLRGVSFEELRMLKVDGVSPTAVETYPFSTRIGVAARSSARGYSLLAKYLRRAEQRFDQDRQYLNAYRARQSDGQMMHHYVAGSASPRPLLSL